MLFKTMALQTSRVLHNPTITTLHSLLWLCMPHHAKQLNCSLLVKCLI